MLNMDTVILTTLLCTHLEVTQSPTPTIEPSQGHHRILLVGTRRSQGLNIPQGGIHRSQGPLEGIHRSQDLLAGIHLSQGHILLGIHLSQGHIPLGGIRRSRGLCTPLEGIHRSQGLLGGIHRSRGLRRPLGDINRAYLPQVGMLLVNMPNQMKSITPRE